MSPKKQRIALVGYGTVAQGLCQILHTKRKALLQEHGLDFDIVAVSTRTRGTMYQPQGLSLSQLLMLGHSKVPFLEYLQDWDAETMIRRSNATIVIELTPTDLVTAEPALSYCKTAIESGKHVITGNKGPAALAYTELNHLARQNRCHFLNEATVLSGTPVFSLFRKALAATRIDKIRGILNGATNFILSEMEQDRHFQQALDIAEKQGYLEADKTADIEGYDAQAKLTILANILLGVPLQLADVKRQGISGISAADIDRARQNNERWKLVATLIFRDNKLLAEVKPEKLPLSDPLAWVMGTENALTFSTDILGEVNIAGPGAGSIETGYAILSDILTINTEDLS